MNIEQLKAALIALGFRDETKMDGPTWSVVRTDRSTNIDHAVHCYLLGRSTAVSLELEVGGENQDFEVMRGNDETAFVARFLSLEVYGSATVAHVLGLPSDAEARIATLERRIRTACDNLGAIDPFFSQDEMIEQISAVIRGLEGGER